VIQIKDLEKFKHRNLTEKENAGIRHRGQNRKMMKLQQAEAQRK